MSATSRLTPVATEGPNIKLAPRPLEQDLLNHDAAPSVTEGVRMQFCQRQGTYPISDIHVLAAAGRGRL